MFKPVVQNSEFVSLAVMLLMIVALVAGQAGAADRHAVQAGTSAVSAPGADVDRQGVDSGIDLGHTLSHELSDALGYELGNNALRISVVLGIDLAADIPAIGRVARTVNNGKFRGEDE